MVIWAFIVYFLHFTLSEIIAFASYLLVKPALPVTSASGPLPLDYSIFCVHVASLIIFPPHSHGDLGAGPGAQPQPAAPLPALLLRQRRGPRLGLRGGRAHLARACRGHAEPGAAAALGARRGAAAARRGRESAGVPARPRHPAEILLPPTRVLHGGQVRRTRWKHCFRN